MEVIPPGRVVNPCTSHGTRFKSADCSTFRLFDLRGCAARVFVEVGTYHSKSATATRCWRARCDCPRTITKVILKTCGNKGTSPFSCSDIQHAQMPRY